MLFDGPRRFALSPGERETLDLMSSRRRRRGLEAGEFSDDGGDSIEEISEEDFRVSKGGAVDWMGEMMRSHNYRYQFNNLAWSKAVKNEPLMEPIRSDSKICVDSSSSSSGGGGGAAGDDDDEREEGELEEGEIGSGSEVVEVIPDGCESPSSGEDLLEKRIQPIREALEGLTSVDVKKSIEEACLRLTKSMESLHTMPVGAVDELVRLSFVGIETIRSVFYAMDVSQREQSRDFVSRMLDYAKSRDPPLFPSNQLSEIEVFLKSIVSVGSQKELGFNSYCNLNDSYVKSDHNLTPSSKKPRIEPISVKTSNSSTMSNSFVASKLEPIIPSRGRIEFSPLIDLHADVDADNLPSPTRENPPPLPFQRPPPQPAIDRGNHMGGGDVTLHPYVTDALKAVSSYQQKFGRNSFISSNRLPSPTPSEEYTMGDADVQEEVSSSSVSVTASRSMGLTSPSIPAVCGTTLMENPVVQGLLSKAMGGNPVVKAQAKSRDPRLRFANHEAGVLDLNTRPVPKEHNANGGGTNVETMSTKNKAAEDLVLDVQALKSQRSGLENHGIVNMGKGRGGWLEDNLSVSSQPANVNSLLDNMGADVRKSGNGEAGSNGGLSASTSTNVTNIVNQQVLAPAGTNASVTLPLLLKEIAAEQQRLAAQTPESSLGSNQPTTQPQSSGLVLGALPSVNVSSVKPSELEPKQAGRPMTTQPVATQSVTMNSQSEASKVRMKPRDPRRVLLNNTVAQRSESLGSDQTKINGAESSSPSSQTVPLPDIGQQFTNKLKNIADIVSSSDGNGTPLAIPQNVPKPVVPSKIDVKADGRTVATDTNNQSTSISNQAAHSSQSENPWGDVDHLLDGYDDQQKAAIQKERARRIEEQNKMFAARKLCLVLDLDHTLLNSAKASKLFEMHLYTMGNKLYATEMAKVLDPKGVLFAGRVISKGDDGGDPFDGDERLPKSKDLDGVLGLESAVVIIDDSVKVWPHHKLNLMAIESRRQFGLSGPSLLEMGVDERVEDGMLASSLETLKHHDQVIKRIHQHFFSQPSLNEVDVRNILASEQRSVLRGCVILFSRVFPVGEANPHLHPLWQTAEQFGAVCTTQIDTRVTHVVAASLGTDKG
ncbi:RNA polymerase II C-terminal domain phosphatase-like 3 [Acorus gramineus]|uniref:protein-serine/threonine phosphatase n=1 Tax=Acorus gramineus TaxID=55184 RepID=A0AAV9A770_ACOGR|nr:RNA polymerase II C-terminal domain phosphatase-like 3 [Acorus gramineus]